MLSGHHRRVAVLSLTATMWSRRRNPVSKSDRVLRTAVAVIGVLGAVSFACGSEDQIVLPGIGGQCSSGVVEALDQRRFEVVADLVRRGATISCLAVQEMFERAVDSEDPHDVAGFLELGMDPTGISHFRGQSDLVEIALTRRDRSAAMAVAQLLVRHGASPNRRKFYRDGKHTCRADDTGLPYPCYDVEIEKGTLLMIAAAQGDGEMAKLLLELGADDSLRDAKQRTALDLAREFGHENVAMLLESRGPR